MSDGSVCAHCALPLPSGAARFCCIGCRIAAAVAGAEGDEGQARWIQARFLLGALFTVAVMTLSLILYSEEVFDAGLEGTALGQLLRWALLALSAPVLLLLAPSLVDLDARGWRRVASLDHWILVAVAAAWLLSAWRVVSGAGALYLESAAMILVLVTLGRALDARARVRVGQAADALRRLLPDRATRLRAGAEEEVEIAEVGRGDVVRVRHGERVPVDGEVVEGAALVDLSAWNGESEPAAREAGETVPAGAVLLDGALDLRVTGAAGERGLDRIASALVEARARRTPLLRVADRLAGFFLPAVTVLALAVLLGHGFAGRWEDGLLRALAVLLVSCPCALGLAAPLATWSALGEAMRRGFLVRDPAALEVLSRVRSALFDKTGTLTAPRRILESVHTSASLASTTAREVAAALAAASPHPAARALQGREAGALASEISVVAGRGVRGAIHDTEWELGSARWMRELGRSMPPTLLNELVQANARGRGTLLLSCRERGVVALFVLREELRPGSAATLQALRQEGVAVEILSGDSHAATACLGAALDAPAEGELLPEAKAARVLQSRASGPVLFVGDGVNDAQALLHADVSVSPGEASELARGAAQVVLLRDDLRSLLELRELARATRTRIQLSLGWALAYNPLFLFLAATGRLSPIACALAMVASSLLLTLFAVAAPPRGANRATPAIDPRAPESAWKSSARPSPSAS